MMKIDRPSAVDGPVGSEGGRSPSTLSTGQAPPALPATPAGAQPRRLGPLAPGQRRSVAPKRPRAAKSSTVSRHPGAVYLMSSGDQFVVSPDNGRAKMDGSQAPLAASS
jgi:hypothetical protein